MKKAIVLVLLAAMCCLCGCGASQVTQGGVTYLCGRDTGNPVYAALSELVGQYVEVVS